MAEEAKLTVAEALAKRKADVAAAKEETAVALTTQEADRELASIPKWVFDLTKWDWKELLPWQVAMLLMRKPYYRNTSTGKEMYRLNPDQALVFAYRASTLGLDPFSSEIWFNPDTWQASATVEGRRKVAKQNGMNFGPPQFTYVEKEWPAHIPNKGGFSTDIEGTCTMEVQGWTKPATYTGRLSEWYRGQGKGSKSPWDTNTMNQLFVRLQGQCLTFASGIGVSEMPDETSFEKGNEEQPQQLQVIDVKAEEFKPLK